MSASGNDARRGPGIAICLVLGVMLVSSPLRAQGLLPGWVQGLLPGGAAPTNPMQALELSEEQGAALARLSGRQAEFAAASAGRLSALQARLGALYSESPMNAEAIAELYRQIFAIQTEIAVAAVNTYNEQLQVLDARQREIWRGMRGAAR